MTIVAFHDDHPWTKQTSGNSFGDQDRSLLIHLGILNTLMGHSLLVCRDEIRSRFKHLRFPTVLA